jgi:ATP-dependent helicase HrpB
VAELFEQFLDIAHAEALLLEDNPPSDSDIAKCVLAGFADQVAIRRGAGTLGCDIVHGRRGLLARQSVASEGALIVAAEIAEIEGRDGDARVSLSLADGNPRIVASRDVPSGFFARAPSTFSTRAKTVSWVRRSKSFRDLVLENRDRDAEVGPAAASRLADQVLAGNLRLNGWDDSVEQWMHRVNFLTRLCPEQNLPSNGVRTSGITSSFWSATVLFVTAISKMPLSFPMRNRCSLGSNSNLWKNTLPSASNCRADVARR